MQHKRKTISGGDVLEAMKEMDFERFVDPLQKCLEGKKLDKYCLFIGQKSQIKITFGEHFEYPH